MKTWKVRPDPQNFEAIIYDSEEDFVAKVFAGEDRDENARLIAAAPELLEALRKFLHIRGILDAGVETGYSEAFDMAEAAIAKAEEK